jgi:leucyl/phenylalanyl-tRNA--protein transferase
MIDCQVKTTHLASLGAREIPRHVFRQLLERHIQDVTYGEKWNFGNPAG